MRRRRKVGNSALELKGSDVNTYNFGISVAISGTTAIVGADSDSSGATGGQAYVFTKSATGWRQVAELAGSKIANDYFGHSVAISGTTAIVGAPYYAIYTGTTVASVAGQAYVFTKTPTGWERVAELKGSDPTARDGFGDSVAISGTTAVVGAAGGAYVFTKTGVHWKQAAKLKAPGASAGAESVAISGTTAVVGAPYAATYEGRAYMFRKTATGWKRVAELDGGGTSVAISGTTIVVGGAEGVGGQAEVFTKTRGAWKQIVVLKDTAAKNAISDFGYSVALSGRTALVGAPEYLKSVGRAYVFKA